jgi:serine/threonine protein kinase
MHSEDLWFGDVIALPPPPSGEGRAPDLFGDDHRHFLAGYDKLLSCQQAPPPIASSLPMGWATAATAASSSLSFQPPALTMQEREDYTPRDFPRLDHRRACLVAESAREHLDKLRDGCGDLAAEAAAAAGRNQRVLAPLDKSEVVLGARLGSGGFSAVYEVQGLRLDPDLDRQADEPQRAAREFLRRRADDPVLALPRRASESSRAASAEGGGARGGRRRSSCGAPSDGGDVDGLCGLVEMCSRRTAARYAVKHMRYSLAENPARFEKAAVDLAVEGRLLQMLDHPNIVSLRGWSRHGTDSFRGGSPSDYFLVIDCLPELLDDRFFAWRQQFRSCQAKLVPESRRPRAPAAAGGVASALWSSLGGGGRRAKKRQEKYEDRLRLLLLERLQVAHDVASGIEYLHKRRVIHRDVKSANIGFDADGVAQVFDLGLARVLPPEAERLHDGYAMSRVGTRSCMAPEVADKLPYDAKADVYGFGVVLWEILSMCTAGEYFRMLRRKEQARAHALASQGPTEGPSAMSSSSPVESEDAAAAAAADDCVLPICPCWSEPLRELVAGCLSRDARLRPTMAEVRAALRRELESGGYEFASPSHPRRRRSTFRLDPSSSSAVTASNTNKDSLLSRDMAAAAKVVTEMLNRNGPLPDQESSTAYASISCTLES